MGKGFVYQGHTSYQNPFVEYGNVPIIHGKYLLKKDGIR